MKRMSGYASSTFGRCSISMRVGSSRMRLSAGAGPLRSSSRPKLRRSRREVTTTVSNKPDFIRRRDASCCSPIPRESIATRDATPTEMPMVVSEFRRRDSRKLRRASSARSGSFTAALHQLRLDPLQRRRPNSIHRQPAFHPPGRSGAGRSARPERARASPSPPSFPIAG